MKAALVSFFCCPHCYAQEFDLKENRSHAGNENISEGVLSCRKCSSTFAIKDRIPRFVSHEEYAGSFGFQWNKFRATQLDSYSGMPLSKERLFLVTQWSKNLEGQLILEAGSGAGRFTEILLETGATVFSFDLSRAVEANLANNGHCHSLNLFQASIYDIPMPKGIFDKIICLGVLQHTPDPNRSFHSLVRHLKPGGEIAIDVYARRVQALLSWKYILRPVTKRLPKDHLFRLVEEGVDWLLPTSIFLRRIGGRYLARLLPIIEYSHYGLPFALNREWSILDTFDMYSPAHDHPRSLGQVRRWFEAAGLKNIVVEYGPNGVIARGQRP